MTKKSWWLLYLFFDLVGISASWYFFNYFRKTVIESKVFGYNLTFKVDEKFITSLIGVVLFWLLIYTIAGFYKDVLRKSRLRETGVTIWSNLIGCVILFFVLILDDKIGSYTNYYSSFVSLFTIHTICTLLPRLIITTVIVRRIHNRIMGFNTIIIGSNEKAVKVFQEIENEKIASGNLFVGFVDLKKGNGHLFKDKLAHLGCIDEIKEIINKHEVEEVLIAIESSEHEQLKNILTELESMNVIIKVLPDMYDILTGSVRMTAIFGAPLIQVTKEIMPQWQVVFKRIFDLCISIFVLTVFSPVFIITGLIVKLTSNGPVIFSQERIGLYGKAFQIYKFRSMFIDAEKAGPALSSALDPRITPFGRFMRRTRLDEIPQFYNVLIGNMSIVGPRPERQFFINQIIKVAPHYGHLNKVKPGITSWGQVKYGYAENVEEMVQRLKYDILYIENMSLAVDVKILIYTVLIVLQGRGK